MKINDWVHGAVAILAAFILYSLMARISVVIPLLINVFSITVIYFAVVRGEIAGSVLGAVCGLIQDSLALGIFGIYGISKTIMGYLAGYAAKRIMLMSRFRLFLFMWILFSLELGFWIVLYFFVFSEPLNIYGGLIFFNPVISAVLGSQFFPLFKKIYRRNERQE